MEPLLLGVEVGTSAVKAVVYDLEGVERSTARRPVALMTPQPGWAEQDAAALWRALLAVLHEAAAESAAHGQIAVLALAAQAGSIVPVDRQGAPLAPLITWLDQRAAPLVAEWCRQGRDVHIREVSGWHPHGGLGLAILAWLTRNSPQLAAHAAQYLDVQGFLLQHLIGWSVTDYSEAAELLLFDRSVRAWSPELCALAGIGIGQLGAVIPAGTPAGRLLPAVATAAGLPPDVLVVAGGQDQCCAALGMGILAPGELMLASGTAWVLTALTSSPKLEQLPPGMDLNFHVVPAVYTASQLLGGFGAVVDWWLTVLYPDSAERYTALDAALQSSGSNDLYFLPLGGSVQAGHAPGGFLGLRLNHTRAEIMAALCQGIGFEVRWALDALAAAHLPAARLWMSGGATHSPHWPALLAAMTGTPVQVAHGANWPARGAALLAGTGAGLLGDLQAAVVRWRLPLATVEPDAHAAARYGARFAGYQAAVQRVAGLTGGEPADTPAEA